MVRPAVRAMLPTSVAKSPRGFTLLELMVVLAVMLIAVGVIIPNITTTTSNAFNAEVRQAVAILKYARRVAIVNSMPQTAHFYALNPRDADYAERKQDLQAKRQTSDWVSEKLSLQFQSDLNQRSEDEEEVEIEFFPQGGSTGGVLTFTRDELRAMLRVDPITGRISVAYNGEELDEEELDAAF